MRFQSSLSSNNVRGFALRAVIMMVLLLVSASTAMAGPFTAENIPGNFSITGVNWDSGRVNVVGRNLTNNAWFSLIGSVYTELSLNSSWEDFGLVGVVNGFAVGNYLDSSFNTNGVSFNGSAVLSIYTDYYFSAAGPGSLGGTQASTGLAFSGSLNGAGALANIHIIPRNAGENAGIVRGVSGSLATGVYDAGSQLNAFLASGPVRLNVNSGTGSTGIGVDQTTTSAFGRRNGEAIEWLPNGTLLRFNDPNTGNPIRGIVCSGFGGLRVIHAGATNCQGNAPGGMFISDGTTVMTFAAYMFGLGNTLGYTPGNAWFVGDPNTLQMALVYPGSIRSITADVNYFRTPFSGGSGGGGEIPEPATIALTGSALAGFAYLRRRKRRGA